MYDKDPLERQLYAQMCCSEYRDTRTLDEKIDKQLYITTALSRKPEDVIKKSCTTDSSLDIFRDIAGRIYKLYPFVGTFMLEDQRNASGAYQGAKYFSYNGKVMDEIRKENESITE